ncbi:MAG: sigma-70 family RNA polymerase sigma factor, partial [Firmicutes bacterium]|nr:sigma-70 family RNA polymerase sigma factor [Bacillota bacterium]
MIQGDNPLFIISIIQTIHDAFEGIFNKYLPMMRRLSFSIVKDYHLAEDAVQEAMIRLSQNTDKIDTIDSNQSKNYVYTVTKNEALKITIKENDRKKFEEDVLFYDESGLNNIDGQLDIDALCDKYGFSIGIAEVINNLVEIDTDIIIYKYGAGYSFNEIAEL